MTHNQPPYRGPAKLDCIQRLVIRPDLANVSHSSPEPRQLFVIRARPGLPLLPLDCQPSIRFIFHPVCILTVSGEEATEGLLTRFVCPPWSLVFFWHPQSPLYLYLFPLIHSHTFLHATNTQKINKKTNLCLKSSVNSTVCRKRNLKL